MWWLMKNGQYVLMFGVFPNTSGLFIIHEGYNYGYPLVNIYISMENHHAINGKSHYFYGNFQ